MDVWRVGKSDDDRGKRVYWLGYPEASSQYYEAFGDQLVVVTMDNVTVKFPNSTIPRLLGT